MAVYSQYNIGGYSSNSVELGEDMSYAGSIGCYQLMEDTIHNETAIFEHVLGCDFAEAQYMRGYISESSFVAINEASLGGIFSKVAEFFKKIGEKIKGIIQNVIDRVMALFTKDGKTLVDKFKKKINEKMNDSYYDDRFKYKWCDEKNIASFTGGNSDWSSMMFDAKLPTNIDNKYFAGQSLTEILQEKVEADDDGQGAEEASAYQTAYADRGKSKDTTGREETDNDKKKNNLDAYNTGSDAGKYHDGTNVKEGTHKSLSSDDINEYKDAILSKILGSSTDMKSFEKDLDEHWFESEDTKEGFTHTEYDKVVKILTEHKKTVAKLEKEKANTDKKIRDVVKEAQKREKELARQSSRNDNYYNIAAFARNCASNVISMGNACTACSTKVYAGYLAGLKKQYKQARALWIKAVSYNKKAVEESTLLEAELEVSDYEVDMMLYEY